MVLFTFMNFMEAVATIKPIDFYFENRLIGSFELNNHDDRYNAFMARFGLYNVRSMDIDTYSNSYIVNL